MTPADAIAYLRSLNNPESLVAAETIEYALSEKTRLAVESDNTQLLNRILRTLRCCGEYELGDELRKLNPSLLPQEGLAVLKQQIADLSKQVADGRLVTDASLGCIVKTIDIALCNGRVEGSHHKQWVIDQMLRSLCGAGYDDVIRDDCDLEGETWDVGIAP